MKQKDRYGIPVFFIPFSIPEGHPGDRANWKDGNSRLSGKDAALTKINGGSRLRFHGYRSPVFLSIYLSSVSPFRIGFALRLCREKGVSFPTLTLGKFKTNTD
ncbi:hypothetical protein TNCT_240331 [Trichonephila clavata]|uniref:Uncharacterized protein n=1 Tax=Trichonephila clavata TaxID=2740835 RepID=A0A8X6KWM2_TRICU|nr:hypothetical protein TNCT_240331 [Trichonephila clavata]